MKRIYIDIDKTGVIIHISVLDENCIHSVNLSKVKEMSLSDFVEFIARDNEQLFIKLPDLF